MAAGEQSASGSAKSKKKAVCWKYFENISNSENTSNERPSVELADFFGEELAYHGVTSTMNEHLKRKRPVETDQAPKPKQLKLDTCTAHKTCTKERSNHINTLVIGMIVRNLRPLNTVNSAGFKALLSYLEPGYRLPSDQYFMGLIEQKYVNVRESVKLRLQQETAFVSITSDIWTSIATHAYLTLTVHFLSSEWDMCSIVLGTKPLTD